MSMGTDPAPSPATKGKNQISSSVPEGQKVIAAHPEIFISCMCKGVLESTSSPAPSAAPLQAQKTRGCQEASAMQSAEAREQ